MCNRPRTAQGCSRQIFFPTELLCDVTDTSSYMELDAETSSEQPSSSPIPAVQNIKYATTRNLIAMTITDIISSNALVCSMERTSRLSRNSRNTSRNKNVAVQNFF